MIANAAALAALLLAAPVHGSDPFAVPFGQVDGDIMINGVEVRAADHLLATSTDQVTLFVNSANSMGAKHVSELGTEVGARWMAKSSVDLINVMASDAESIIRELEKDPNIRTVELDSAVHLPPDEAPLRRRLEEKVPYGIDMVFEGDREWLSSLPDPEGTVKICVVDTGYDVNHQDLPTGVDGYSPYSGQAWDTDGHGHGSHCAGTIAATGDNDKGVVGVIPNMNDSDAFSFFIGKGLTNTGGGSWSGVILASEACRDNGATVISMSLGGGYNAGMETVFNEMYKDDDVLIIAAAGNSGNSALLYPASYAGAMSVAAVDSQRNKASFSQYNAQLEIAAPGVGVLSTLPNNQYAAWSGTSMACPHVAGVAGFLRAHFPACRNFQIRHAMTVTSIHDTATCDIRLGFGIVSAKAAYIYLSENPCGVDDPQKAAVGGCAENSCVEHSDCDDGDATTNDQCLSGGCVFSEGPPPTNPPTPPPTPPPSPPTGGDGPGSGVPAPIDIDLFLLQFDFIAEEACVSTDLTRIPGGPTSGQCAQACASLANCDGFVQLEAGTCAMTAEVMTGDDCVNDDTTNVWFYDRKVVMHMD